MLNKELLMMGGGETQVKVGTLTIDATRMNYHYVDVYFLDGTKQSITLEGVYKYPNNTVLNVFVSQFLEITSLVNMYNVSIQTWAVMDTTKDALVVVTLGSN